MARSGEVVTTLEKSKLRPCLIRCAALVTKRM